MKIKWPTRYWCYLFVKDDKLVNNKHESLATNVTYFYYKHYQTTHRLVYLHDV